MIINSFEKSKSEHEYIYRFVSTFELTPKVIEAMVLFIKEDMKDFYLYEYTEKNKDKKEVASVSDLTYEGTVLVSGHDKIADTDLVIFFYPHTKRLKIMAECDFIDNFIIKDKDKKRHMTEDEKRTFFCIYVDSLEIAAHTYLKAGECYNKLFIAGRYYVNSNYNPELALFEDDDGYMLNLEFLFSGPEKNSLPPS